jgi:DNA-binding SARP family transcriptional activator
MHTPKSDPVRIAVLGPVEVTHGANVVYLSKRQQTLLASLALAYGEVVPVDQLIATLWGTAAPATARTKLQAHVSALRQALEQPARREGGPLVTCASGYLLSQDGADLDLAEFDTLMRRARTARESGDPAAESELSAIALGLWRGSPCADVISPLIRAAAAPLAERRVLAVEAKAEADLAIGRCAAVAAELPPWVFRLPLRERLRGLLMVALYRLGCRVEALKLYRDGRRIMVSETGLEPGAQLRALHRHIMADAGTAGPMAAAGRAAGQPAGTNYRDGVGQIADGRGINRLHERAS